VAGMGPCKRPGLTGEGTETLAYRRAVPVIRDPGSARMQTPESISCGYRSRSIEALRWPRCSPSDFDDRHPRITQTEGVTKRDLSCPWPQVLPETETWQR